MLKLLKQLLAYVMLHTKNANKLMPKWSDSRFGRQDMIAEEEILSLLELGPSLTGSREAFVHELRGMMPFTSNEDYKALSACLQYHALLGKANENTKFLEKRPEYQFGKWLVETLYNNKKHQLNNTLDSYVKRILRDTGIQINR